MSNDFEHVRLSFSQLKMQSRFLDRNIAKVLTPFKRRFFMRAGGAIRTTARRMLRKARQQKLTEMGGHDRHNYEVALRLYKQGTSKVKPRRPDVVSEPGKPPVLHVVWDNGTSPLKNRLWFALTEDASAVLIGPAAIGHNRAVVKHGGISTLRDLERSRPFMAPSYKIIQPKFPDYMRQAAR